METIIILVCIFAFILLALIIGSFYFYHKAVGRNKKAYLSSNKDLSQIYESRPQSHVSDAAANVFDTEWIEAKNCETWNVTSGDGLKLAAYYIPAAVPTDKTAILAHGYSSGGKSMGAFAKFFRDSLGFNILMPDARGHGASEGKYIGFGWHERKDSLLWIDKVLKHTGEDSRIVLFGISMGAATVMSAGGEKLPVQVKAVIEDCGYSSLWDELSYQMKRIYRLPAFPFMQITSLITRLRAGYGFREVSALEQIKKCTLPVLFMHGEDDTFVPCEMVRELYGACPGEKDMLIVKGAGHGMAYSIGGAAYENKIKEFIGRYV